MFLNIRAPPPAVPVPVFLPADAILFRYIFGFKLNKFVIKQPERKHISLGAFAELRKTTISFGGFP